MPVGRFMHPLRSRSSRDAVECRIDCCRYYSFRAPPFTAENNKIRPNRYQTNASERKQSAFKQHRTDRQFVIKKFVILTENFLFSSPLE